MCSLPGDALHSPAQAMLKPGFLLLQKSHGRAQRVKGPSQSHTADEPRGRFLAQLVHLASKGKVYLLRGLPLLPHSASCMFMTFQVLLSALLVAI